MIYLHVPFCGSFCTYCDFYSEICRSRQVFNEYADAVIAEIRDRRKELEMNMSAQDAVNTLYIGGGTPSVLPLDVLSRIVGAVSQTERLSLVTEPVEVTTPTELFDEFTVEVNPEDIVEKGREYVRGLLALGVNRISMGIQSFNDDILRWMNRRHDAGNAVKAFHILRESGVRNISIDLIFGISQLTDETWKDTIEKALELSPEHISAYQLSIEEGSALAKMVADGRYVEASEEQCRRQYDILCRCLGRSGYHHYEISNFAKPGFEAVHNSAYWRRAPYIGLGPGAHSLTGNVRSWNSQELPHRQQDETSSCNPDRISSCNPDSTSCQTSSRNPSGKLATYSRNFETLSPEDIRVERIMLSLRTDKGLKATELYSLADRAVINSLLSEGALEKQGGSICIPESRLFTSDEIIRELI
uniref:radical SAM family heme chaperone HemW n=1 Tax=Candidatus Cryptobacteroides bacterium TaxID=3085639 RepID=UPI0040285DD1